ncbi:GntR family transcriptional regulator [Pseudonocardia sp. GCM10023141]|uniref:GntR family transcriptional regulator n=1 Tax=Pseudonocardia sp. GCM10023141 TaxID=3252653 RepID=UPI00360D7E18
MEGLAADRALLVRTSTAERVAGILRGRILEGYFPPGTRLVEDSIGAALGVSRNTLREAFRLLSHERLLVHELNRGVFVRTLTTADVEDLFRLRLIIEGGALRGIRRRPAGCDRVAAAVAEGAAALARDDTAGLVTANLRFHQALAALAGSRRVDELMDGLLAEVRLVFHAMADPRSFHVPYLARNREILAALEAGAGDEAAMLLDRYLNDARSELVAAHL